MFPVRSSWSGSSNSLSMMGEGRGSKGPSPLSRPGGCAPSCPAAVQMNKTREGEVRQRPGAQEWNSEPKQPTAWLPMVLRCCCFTHCNLYPFSFPTDRYIYPYIQMPHVSQFLSKLSNAIDSVVRKSLPLTQIIKI
jgi:hypothetical protein